MSWSLRLRSGSGQSTLRGIDGSTSVNDFLKLVAENSGVPVGQQELLIGFPPKPVQLPNDTPAVTVGSLGFTNGDTIVVRQSQSSTPSPQVTPAAVASSSDMHSQLQQGLQAALSSIPASSSRQQATVAVPAKPVETHSTPAPVAGPAPTSVRMPDGSCVTRRIIDSDNSCLFNAVGYTMELSRKKAADLRKVIASVVASDPETYNDAFLGKDNQEYCSWIQQKDKWGGAIELSILSQHYRREISAYDIQTKRCDTYGQDAGYSERAMLIYDGLHYDALAVSAFEGAPEELDITIIDINSPESSAIAEAATKLVEASHKARQFTDTATFTLRCGVCQLGFKGEKEAVQHAKTTGHSNFSEY